MASISELLLIANLCLSGSVFGFPLNKDTEQTCGYEVGLMFVPLFDDKVTNWSTSMKMCRRFQTGFVVIQLTVFRADVHDASSISVVPELLFSLILVMKHKPLC